MARRFSKQKIRWNRTFQATLALLLLLGAASESFAQQLEESRLKSGFAVRHAFREVVAEPGRSTVAVLSGKKQEQIALGSIIDSEGYILTKASEMKGKIVCRLRDGQKKEARLIGVHPESDLAVLKIDATGLVPVSWSKETKTFVGQWLATTGIEELPIAVGVLSVEPRTIQPQPGFLGISTEQGETGPRITHVFSNTGAAAAGLISGDVITRIAGEVVKNHDGLVKVIKRFRPGDTLRFLVLREDKELTIRATLSTRSSSHSRSSIQNSMGGELSSRRADFPTVFQHDTVLRPEECGGPVVGLNGDVIGINIARAGRTETYAIPTAMILPLLDDLKSGKLLPTSEAAIIAGTPEPTMMP